MSANEILFVGQERVMTSPPFLLEVLPLSRFSASVQDNKIVSLKVMISQQVFTNLDAMQTYLDLQHSSTVIENLK